MQGRGNYSKHRPLAAAGAHDRLHSWHDSCMIARNYFHPFRVCSRDNGFDDRCMCIGLLSVSRGLHEAIICDKLWNKSVKEAMRWCFLRKMATFILRSLMTSFPRTDGILLSDVRTPSRQIPAKPFVTKQMHCNRKRSRLQLSEFCKQNRIQNFFIAYHSLTIDNNPGCFAQWQKTRHQILAGVAAFHLFDSQ